VLVFLAVFYIISPATAETLQVNNENFTTFKSRVESGEATLDAELTEDIVLDNWTDLIGRSPAVNYNGTFNGNNHKITLKNEDYGKGSAIWAGLFNTLDTNAVVKNLKLEVTVNTNVTSGNQSNNPISPIAYLNFGTIQDVEVDCKIVTSEVHPKIERKKRGKSLSEVNLRALFLVAIRAYDGLAVL
jgi:hypothetical protein